MEALEAGREIDKVILQKGLAGNAIRELKTTLQAHKIPVQEVPPEKFNKLTRTNHQGVLAYISLIGYASLDHIISSSYQAGRSPRLIILDRINDVRNFGAIARTAEGMGFDSIIIPSKGSAQINEEAMKTSSGALNHIPICREQNLQHTIKYLKESGIVVIGCTEKAHESIYSLNLAGPIALLFGSEEDGISPLLLKSADHLVRIPMKGRIASFNVSVSVAIMAGEVLRQSGI